MNDNLPPRATLVEQVSNDAGLRDRCDCRNLPVGAVSLFRASKVTLLDLPRF
jgi:hypothetical protein